MLPYTADESGGSRDGAFRHNGPLFAGRRVGAVGGQFGV
jgi:hypothetical protein